MKKILLIAYKYPPYNRVGSYRWNCLSKYLARLGHQIHVVTVNWRGKDIEDNFQPNITVHRIASGYPHNLKYTCFTSMALKLLKKAVLWQYKFMDDEAQKWGKYLIPFCEKLIQKENIEVIIATGHPFQANRWAALLKKRYPELKLIQDFQDPWSEDPDRSLTASRYKQIKAWQKEAVDAADCVVAVTQGLLNLYLEEAAHSRGRVIENGVDGENILPSAITSTRDGKIVITYLGSLNNGRDKVMDELLNCIQSNYEQLSFLKIVIIGAKNYGVNKSFHSLAASGNLQMLPLMAQPQAFAELWKADYALQINAKQHSYLVSTKIYEYGALKVPTVSLNYGGEIETLIQKYQLGYSINMEKCDLCQTLLNLQKSSQQFAMDSDSFLYQNKAVEYSQLINE